MLTFSAVTRVLFFCFIGLLAVVIFSVAALTISAHREYTNTKKRLTQLTANHDQLQKRLEAKQSDLSKIKTDPEFLERIIREKLHYIRSDEVIFYFERPRSQQNMTSFSR